MWIAGLWPILLLLACFLALRLDKQRPYVKDQWHYLAALCFGYYALYAFILNPIAGSFALWLGFCGPFVVYFCFTRRIDFKPFYAILLLFAANLLVQQFFFEGALNYYDDRESWPVLNPNNAACLVNIGLAYSMITRRYAAAFVFIAALICTESMAGFLTAYAVIYCTIRHKARHLMLLPLLALPFVWVQALDAFADRPLIWLSTLQMIADYPLGVGFGNFAAAYANYRIEGMTSGMFAHNELLHIAAETGIAGAVLMAAFVLFTVLGGSRHNRAFLPCLLPVLLHGLPEFAYYHPAIALYTAVLINNGRYAYANLHNKL